MVNLDNLHDLTAICEQYNAQLIAVSKTKPLNDIQVAYDAGHRSFGENKVQELTDKQKSLPKDIEWHMIGHLQRNKVKYIAPFVHMIHAVDSERLLLEIDKQAQKNDRVIDILLQIHIAQESSKFGFGPEEIEEVIKNWMVNDAPLSNIRIAGLMGMATYTNDEAQIASEFRTLKNLFDSLKTNHFLDDDHFRHISMGMTGDYRIALAEGSTMIRVGSAIFGSR